MRYRLCTLPTLIALPFAVLAVFGLLLAWTHSSSPYLTQRLFVPAYLQSSVLLCVVAILAFVLAESFLDRPIFRYTIRGLLLFTAVVALMLALALTVRRAQRLHHDLVTCGPNNLKPNYLSR